MKSCRKEGGSFPLDACVTFISETFQSGNVCITTEKTNTGGRFIFAVVVTQGFIVSSTSAIELNYRLRLFVFAGCKRLGCVSTER